MELRKPNFARPGDTIGIYSPSSAIEAPLRSNYERGKQILLDRGYLVREAPHTFDWKAHYSSSGQDKASDLLTLLRDESVTAILPTVGGTTAYQLLPYLDFDSIRNLPPKMVFGFSDNSLQASVLTDKTGLVTFHGHSDVVFGLADLADIEKSAQFALNGEYTSAQFFDALEGRLDPGPIKKATNWQVLRGGQAEGRLIGGNLDVLQILHGTPYELSWRNKIFYWEAAYTELHRVDLMLASFAMTGILAQIEGMVVGKGSNLQEEFFSDKHESLDEMIIRHCEPYSFPIIAEADIGHDMECCVLPNGVLAKMANETLTLLESPYV